MNDVAIQTSSMLVPTNIGDAMKLAEMMANAKLVPNHLQGKPADCLLVIEQASRWKMSPFAVAQCTSVIQGKLMYEGKLVAAVVNANGGLSERLSFKYDGVGENRKITVSGKFPGEQEARTVDVTFKDVKTANSMWLKQPDQQLMYSGTRAWARRHAPELMLGVYSPEEFEPNGMVDVTPEPSAKSIFKNASLRNGFVSQVVREIESAADIDEVRGYMSANKAKIDDMIASGNEHDSLCVEELRKRFDTALKRFKAPLPREGTEADIKAMQGYHNDGWETEDPIDEPASVAATALPDVDLNTSLINRGQTPKFLNRMQKDANA